MLEICYVCASVPRFKSGQKSNCMALLDPRASAASFLKQHRSLRGVDFEIGACCWDSSQQHKGRPFGGRFERRGKEARKDYTYFHLDWRRKAQGTSLQ